MSTQENLNNEKQSSNGWQNIGICSKFAEDKIDDPVLRSVYMAIVHRSFGYGKIETNEISQEELAKASAISVRSLRDKLKILEQMKILNIKSKNTYRAGGGSYACIYRPEFPTGYGFIKQFDTNSKSSEPDDDSLDKIRKKDEELRNDKYF